MIYTNNAECEIIFLRSSLFNRTGRKIFSLLLLIVAMVTVQSAYAGDIFTANFGGKLTSTPEGFFTVVDPKINYNSKYYGTYEGETIKNGLKLQSSTKVEFTTTAKSTITIVQSISNNKGNYIALDETMLSERTDDEVNNVGVYVVTNVKPGKHIINRAKSECGLLYVKVEYTGSSMPQLTEPTISFNNETGTVTLSQAESKDIYYTTDGTTPSTTVGTKYNDPFTVEDGTTINAIAIGDGTNNLNSKVATYYALLKTVAIQKPEIAQLNGTVAISCATPGTTLKYSVNGGALQDYTYPFTLNEDGIVKAQALRENCITVETNETKVITIKSEKNKTLVLDYKSFDNGNTANITGKDAAEGINISNNKDSKYQGMTNAVTINGKKFTAIKLSADKINSLTLPAGLKATKITFYSVANYSNQGVITGFSDVNGEQEYKSFPMGAYKDAEGNFATTPDIRVYPLDNATEITFKFTGTQIGVVIILDLIDENNKSITLSRAGMGTFSSTTTYKAPDELRVYTATSNGTNVTLTKVNDNIITAGQGVVLSGEKNGSYTLTPTTDASATDWTKNELKNTASAAVTINDDNTYVLIANAEDKGQFTLLNNGQEIPVGKAYLTVDVAGAKSLSMNFDNTTGINAIETAETENDAYYTLSGQKTVKPVKGIYIHNGKKYIAK